MPELGRRSLAYTEVGAPRLLDTTARAPELRVECSSPDAVPGL